MNLNHQEMEACASAIINSCSVTSMTTSDIATSVDELLAVCGELFPYRSYAYSVLVHEAVHKKAIRASLKDARLTRRLSRIKHLPSLEKKGWRENSIDHMATARFLQIQRAQNQPQINPRMIVSSKQSFR